MEENNTNNSNSMLENILSSSWENTTNSISNEWINSLIQENNISNNQTQKPNNNVPPNNKNKPKKSTGDVFRIISSILLAVVVMFGAFLAYIVFNPNQVQFFISLWIDPKEVKDLLKTLVSISFGCVTFVLTIISLIFLFRAFFTKKEFTKKKTIAIILSIFFILLLFTTITLWAFLVQKIWATDYANLDWMVIVYDNDKKKSEKFKDWWDIINNFDNLIWPVTMQFDFSANAKYVSKFINITGYSIDFDWDWKIDKEGTNPWSDQDIIFTFDKKWSFNPVGIYKGIDKATWKEVEEEMKNVLPAINIAWMAILTEKDDRIWWKRVVIDVNDIKKLGKIDFYLENWTWDFKIDSNYNQSTKYSPTQTFKKESLICLTIVNNQKTLNNCDKMFIVWTQINKNSEIKILEERDVNNPLSYRFSLEYDNSKMNIDSYEWIMDDINRTSEKDFLDYNFASYWKHNLKVNLTESNWSIITIQKEINIVEKLSLIKWENRTNSLLRINSIDDKSVIDNTYDEALWFYHIKIPIPSKINFDARYVRVTDKSYNLSKVEWNLDWDDKFEKITDTLEYNFLENKKYTIVVKYTFESKIRKDTQILEEKIIFETDKKWVDINLDITKESDYAPTIVHFDWSASTVMEWNIVKFTYDFGEWKSPVEWDAKQDYKYNFPWEYVITFTVTKEDWTKSEIKKKIILKTQQKDVVINTSVSTWLVEKNIDFDATGSNWQISSYEWDFGDWEKSYEPTPTHAYKEVWTYKIKLTVTYADWIVKNGTRDINIR